MDHPQIQRFSSRAHRLDCTVLTKYLKQAQRYHRIAGCFTRLGRLRTEENKILDFQGLWISEIFSPNPIIPSPNVIPLVGAPLVGARRS
jgi:hypothetical protein